MIRIIIKRFGSHSTLHKSNTSKKQLLLTRDPKTKLRLSKTKHTHRCGIGKQTHHAYIRRIDYFYRNLVVDRPTFSDTQSDFSCLKYILIADIADHPSKLTAIELSNDQFFQLFHET